MLENGPSLDENCTGGAAERSAVPGSIGDAARIMAGYTKANLRVLDAFHMFGVGCPARLRVNVYRGCAFQCRFCYVCNHPHEPRVFSRDIAKYLKKDIETATGLGLPKLPVMVSCSTDPFQPLETDHKYALSVLQTLAHHGFPLVVITQNPQIFLDPEYAAVAQKTPLVVEVTIPSMSAGPAAEGIFHSEAPPASERFSAIAELVSLHVPVRLRLDPIIPRIRDELPGQTVEDIREAVGRYAEIFAKSSSDVSDEMMVISNVMTFDDDVKYKLRYWNDGVASEYSTFFTANEKGEPRQRSDGLRMQVLKRELQEELLQPVVEACSKAQVPLCPCVANAYFCGSRDCVFPAKDVPLSMESELAESRLRGRIRTRFPAASVEEYEKRSLGAAKRFLCEDLEFLTSLSSAAFARSKAFFSGSTFQHAIRERKIREFLENRELISAVLKGLLNLEESETSRLDMSMPCPVLYWIFAPIIRMLNVCSRDKAKPDMMWGSVNFWDPLTESHCATQFLQSDYYKPGDRIFFGRVVRNWLLRPGNDRVHTVTQLFLTDPWNRKIIALARNRNVIPPELCLPPAEASVVCQLELPEVYSEIADWMNKHRPRYEARDRVLGEKESIDSVMEWYLSPIEEEMVSQVSAFCTEFKTKLKDTCNLRIERTEGEVKRFLRVLLVFDLVAPEDWKWLVTYPCLIFTGTPIGGVFLVLRERLDAPVDRLLQHMVSSVFAIPQVMIDKQRVLEQSLRSAVAAIMARNMSHNIGSHVLAGVNMSDSSYGSSMKLFSRYLQERMDFIAGVTAGWAGTTESVWFYGELLNGFLQNVPLLDWLVRSHGYSCGNIHFVMNGQLASRTINDGRSEPIAWYKYYSEKQPIGLDEAPVEDFLVGIPRGRTGCHAFYTILENVMRNSAKYGEKEEDLRVFINCTLDEEKGGWGVEIFDNLSPNIERGGKALAAKINDMIRKPVIDETTGTPNYENMGIVEMKECARLLAGSSADSLYVREDAETRYYIWADEDRKDRLTYKFYLEMPKNLLIVDPRVRAVPAKLGIHKADSQGSLASSNQCYALTILSDKMAKNQESKAWPQWFWPYRVLDGYDVPEQFTKAQVLEEDWKGFILSSYKDWFKTWRAGRQERSDLPERKYHIVISFDGSARESIANRWQGMTQLEDLVHLDVVLTDDESKLLKKLAYCSAGGQVNSIAEHVCRGNDETLVVYDNHEVLSSVFKNEGFSMEHLAIHHSLTGDSEKALKLFALLSSPPKDPFLKDYLILSLLETALAKVLVIDERVAESFIDAGKIDNDRMEHFRKNLGIYIPLSIDFDGSGGPLFVSKPVENAVRDSALQEYQSASLRRRGWAVLNSLTQEEKAREFDIIVIHQGIVDEWIAPRASEPKWYLGGYETGRHVVVTSGRGPFIKHVQKEWPFLDFSVIKANLIDDISKYHLVKALTTAKGGLAR
ncbi:MAG: radical SAM protein [Candidatus Eisenbacteria bacterium]|nr:radical SAM protein [Candidatus Eisenbacteria bacterium]